MLTDCRGINQVAFLRKECGDEREGFRRDFVDGCEAILDVPCLPQYLQELRNGVINLDRTDISDSLIPIVVAQFEPVWTLQRWSNYQGGLSKTYHIQRFEDGLLYLRV